MLPILVKNDEVITGTKTNVHLGRLRLAQASMAQSCGCVDFSFVYFLSHTGPF